MTVGKTQKYVPYKDFRCKNTQISINYAKSEGLHVITNFCWFILGTFLMAIEFFLKGIVANTEELHENLHLINILFNDSLKSANFLSYAWGDELNQIEKRKLFVRNGINGIIYDRVHHQDHTDLIVT